MKPLNTFLKACAFVLSSVLSFPLAGETITGTNLYENSQSWPYRASLLQQWESVDGRRLPENLTGVLIRVRDDGTAIVDFGRFGIGEVAIEATDLVSRANAIAAGDTEKDDQNYAMTIGLRLTDSTSPELPRVPYDSVKELPYFLTVYTNDNLERLQSLAEGWEGLAPLLERKGVCASVIPVGVERNSDKAFAEKITASGLDLPFMPTFLGEPFAAVLWHHPQSDELPLLVLVDANGKLLERADPSAPIAEQIEVLRDAIAGLPDHKGAVASAEKN